MGRLVLPTRMIHFHLKFRLAKYHGNVGEIIFLNGKKRDNCIRSEIAINPSSMSLQKGIKKT